MPKADSTFNALGGVMEVYKQTIEEYEAKLAKAKADQESLLKLVGDLHKQLLEAKTSSMPLEEEAEAEIIESPE